jgi:hypothetical protein
MLFVFDMQSMTDILQKEEHPSKAWSMDEFQENLKTVRQWIFHPFDM